jgi:hypothetical protein
MVYRIRSLARVALLVLLPACGDDAPQTSDAASTPSTTDAGNGGPGTGGGAGQGNTDGGQGSGAVDGGAAGADGAAAPAPLTGEDFVAQAADFDCLKDWTKVRAFRVANGLGKLEASLAVANAPDGGTYPVGTILQLVPTEAMVKRAVGFSPETRDWEFFALTVSAEGTQITSRGKGEVVNQFGLQCFACHNKAAPQFDLVCESTHGCDPLPLSTSFLESLQDSDPRCR